jgi:hypothetical protein
MAIEKARYTDYGENGENEFQRSGEGAKNTLYGVGYYLLEGWKITDGPTVDQESLRVTWHLERTIPDPEPTLSSQLREVYDYLSNLLLRPAAVAEQKEYRAILQKAIDEVEELEARIAELESERDEWKRKYIFVDRDSDAVMAESPLLTVAMERIAELEAGIDSIIDARGPVEAIYKMSMRDEMVNDEDGHITDLARSALRMLPRDRKFDEVGLAHQVMKLQADNARLRSALKVWIADIPDWEIWSKHHQETDSGRSLTRFVVEEALDGRGPDAIPRTATIIKWWHKVDETTVSIEGNLRTLAINLWNEMIKHSHSVSSNEVLEFAERLNNLIYRIDREVGVEMAEETDNS